MTKPKNLQERAVHVKETWGPRCNKILYMSDKEDPNFPAVGLNTTLGRKNVGAENMHTFDYIFRHHLDDADWFLKADDDTYVIVENLRYMLSAHSPQEPVIFGHHLNALVNQSYDSRGSTYVLSREALMRFGKREATRCHTNHHGYEDVEFERCMEKLGIKSGDSTDLLHRSRFDCFSTERHIAVRTPKKFYPLFGSYSCKKVIKIIPLLVTRVVCMPTQLILTQMD